MKMFHTFAEETGAYTQSVKDDIIDCCKTVVSLEDKFIELAFEAGEVEGMTPDDIKRYIRYIADWRLDQLKLPPIYGAKEHPLPWLTEILNGVEHANFFEARATEYSKGATKGDWHGDEGVWSSFDNWGIGQAHPADASRAGGVGSWRLCGDEKGQGNLPLFLLAGARKAFLFVVPGKAGTPSPAGPPHKVG